ncbi:cyclopropane-fatty-acyl-phospholipid synthase [Candidatus Uhrbacteria bacterium RIFCSPLOWO2_12_FULL_46_10]|uniref:Cyclopropane-fatty-acyl-phospholipid synthase n=1 Tax=Candidatus Uhrbacteria bacterium RIFCSPLOWO2_01_FULL_47_25 TaxID=1802402 RepID=A0A1F7UWQ2_9BACT|nr:MAG: cyclopropane fatty acyl phospholipid synthase [Parcubacteria group bacterium GW2011_GWA2_46_9]OGL59060.1 MAG: cyclopropane-fatty-acyl-phospholipid synthase [Candidatus Uhrbacteria bacterium RIFCSPHIGHO2_01_FULL_46_23]OGL68727.1 MAG: cyclopropane-fatty-acyl-phospholipid synthase [Candidatus Uhrbacteria bacterium RIFCSPHIGHO2_02_FULL_47_29]OGL74753.1 MAG: cyclopropane-fatty-acyl-phospholipid synthase [Candidatus Uhrbacteria bacterium RIFCSPHIGHO2_12_FULL_46_13]OGL82164.1 MAG: cyclopropane
MKKSKEIIKSLLASVGITINGNNPYDLQIHNADFYSRILRQGSLGLGESYMDGWWDCERLDQFFDKVLGADIDSRVRYNWNVISEFVWNSILNAGRKSKSFEIGKRHYDIGNDLYRTMLDKRLTYTCGYWGGNPPAGGLDDAQEAKLGLVCRKIGLKRGQKILDIGSGWGSFIGYVAEKYGVSALGITVSKEQKELADTLYKNLSAETRLQDYRDINEKFNHVVSLGMFEHVGYKNYRTFMKVVHNVLKDDGLFLLQTIGVNRSVRGTDPWIEKYIFPNSMLPSIRQISKAIEGLFVMEDWHNFGADYDKTLMAWHKNFEDNWDSIKSNYDERFYRMWRYYLLACAGSFRARKNQLWQIVLSKKGVPGGYILIR